MLPKKKVNEFSGQKHRLSNLDISEVSLVTTPAILSDDEAENGVGAVIVKFADGRPIKKGQVPTHLQKVLSIKDDQELWDVLELLSQAARTHLAVFTANPDMHWADLTSIKGSEILLSDWWSDVTFALPFEQQADGSFVFGDPTQVELAWVPVQSDDGEVTMTKLIKFAVGDHIVETPVVAGTELKIGDAVVKLNDAGELELSDALKLDAEGVIRFNTVEAPSVVEAETPAPVEKETTPVRTDADKKVGDIVDTTEQSVLKQALDMVKDAKALGLEIAKFSVKDGVVDLDFQVAEKQLTTTVTKVAEVTPVVDEVADAQAAAGNTVEAAETTEADSDATEIVDIEKNLSPAGGFMTRFILSNSNVR